MRSYLWIIDLQWATRQHHGGLLRYFNMSRELVAQGHSVTFAVCIQGDRESALAWMSSLQAECVCTSYSELLIPPLRPQWRRLASFLLPFGLHELVIRPFVRQSMSAIESILHRFPADLVIVSSRQLVFTAHNLAAPPSIGDFSDSFTLYFWRELIKSLRDAEWKNSARNCWYLFHFFFREMHSSRKYAANIVSSPVDKRVFDLVGNSKKNVCILNGVRQFSGLQRVPKFPNQIVFSGAMDFAPNYNAAIWFLDKVFPAVLERLPGLTFAIAGTNPTQDLLARAGPNVKVLGYVDDLHRTLAESALYVAPLVTGSGFKNKILEAIASGTYVIGTSYAVEFLDREIRELVTVRDDPQEMATAICEFLLAPEKMNYKLARLRQIVEERFCWAAKAEELVQLGETVISGANSYAIEPALKASFK